MYRIHGRQKRRGASLRWSLLLFGTAWFFLFPPGTATQAAPSLENSRSEVRKLVVRFATSWLAGETADLDELFVSGSAPPVAELREDLGSAEVPSRWHVLVASPSLAIAKITWPTGLWEIVRIRVDGRGDAPKIAGLFPASRVRAAPVTVQEPMAAAQPRAEERSPLFPWVLGVGACLLLAGLVARSLRVPLLGVGCLAIGGAFLLPRGTSEQVLIPPGQETSGPSAGASEPARLRDSMAGGLAVPPATLERLAPADRAQLDLWSAMRLQANGGDSSSVRALLQGLPSSFDPPVLGLVRAQAEWNAGEETAAALELERFAATLEPGELFWLDVGRLWEELGFEQRAEEAWDEIERAEPDSSEAWYRFARADLIDSTQSAAERSFRRAWSLEPVARADLLRDPILAWLVGVSPEVRSLVEFERAAEPALACPRPSAPLVDGELEEAWTLGSSLAVRLGGSEILVPSGCDLAPLDTPAETAEGARRRRSSRWLDYLHSGAPLRGPLLEEAAASLARRGQWTELIRVVPAPTPSDPVPLDAVRYRALALQRLGRSSEAIPFLTDVAARLIRAGAPDPWLHDQLADQLLDVGARSAALRILELADRRWPRKGFDRRLLQVRIEDRLLNRALQQEVGRFQLSYPPTQDSWFVQRVGRLLESEARRLERWIPPGSGRPIRVLFLTSDDFREAYGGGGPQILGLWDGMVRIPYGDVVRLEPSMISVLTHELAHALIADATSDLAPAWLHEGLAQHVQLVQPRANPITDPHRRVELLPFPLIEPVLSGPPHPELTTMAYEEALWAVHFIEERYGVEGIRKLLETSGSGGAPQDLLQTALGVDGVEFHAGFFHWARNEAPRIWPLDRETLAEYLPPPPPGPASEEAIEQAVLEGLLRLLTVVFADT